MPLKFGSTDIAAIHLGSTEVSRIYLGSTIVYEPFEDGSLVIEDDTLDVLGGATVNLRVKLGAKPRSDVTVALSETSALISLGDTSLTFTPNDWDTYQSVVVTAAGNRQEMQLPASAWSQSGTYNRVWRPTEGPDFLIAAGLNPGTTDFYLQQVAVVTAFQGNPARIRFDIALSGHGTSFQGGQELTTAFENNGGIDVTVSGTTYSFNLGGADTTEPYLWAPSNGADVTSLYGAIASAIAATLVIRDYTLPADPTATISLTASGTDEYAGVTGSATVTVS